LAAALEACAAPRFFVAVDGLTNADNLGVIIRNCAAFGVQALIVGETCCNPFLRKSVRSSMGTIFRLPIVEVASLTEALAQMRAEGVRSVAAHPHTKQVMLSQSKLAADCCIVLGSEGDGISPAVLAACDEAAAIPMHGSVDSLNVSSASAAFLYEVQRQRGKS
jgi:TrmH family RNA methyltransferase